MATEVVGYLEEIINKGTGKGSGVRIAGTRYGAYDPKAHGLENVSEGDRVAINYVEKGNFKNLVGKVMKVDNNTGPVAAPTESAPSKSSGGFRQFGTGGGFPVGFEAYEVSLIRREAVNAVLGTLKPGTQIDFDNDIKPIADDIVKYVCGWDLVPPTNEAPEVDDPKAPF